jgi:NADH dehydrogenase FAD-containing subunit
LLVTQGGCHEPGNAWLREPYLAPACCFRERDIKLTLQPRYAVLPSHEHKAFIPYRLFDQDPSSARHGLDAVVRAKVVSVHPDRVVLDRPWQGSTELPYEYLAIATGTRLSAPGTMEAEEKSPSVQYFQRYQQQVLGASSIVIIGGGAVGVQMATDLKELYPAKKVTLVQSRDRVMPKFHPQFHEFIAERFAELGVELITGSRVVVPEGGFPSDGSTFAVKLKDGRELQTQLVIPATGQTPNNELVTTLPSKEPLINPDNGFIRVEPTLQLPGYHHIFSVGDIADTGAHKAARPGAAQAAVLAKNVLALIEGREPADRITITPPALHITLGLQKNMVFRNPPPGETEPSYVWRDDGKPDMNIDGVWARRGVRVNCVDDYHL